MATFGYTQVGANVESPGRRMSGSVFTCPENGVAESISFYVPASGSGSSRTVQCAIYRHSDSSLVGATEQKTLTSWQAGWMTLNFLDPKPELQAGVDYVLIVYHNGSAGFSPKVAYDSGDFPEQGHYQSLTNFPLPNPANFTHENRKYSIYCTYTPSAIIKQWSSSLKTVHALSTPTRSLKISQTLGLAHAFICNRYMKLTQALQTLHTWTVVKPSLILKRWVAILNLTHVLRRPFRRIGYLQQLQSTHVPRRPTRLIRLPAALQLVHFYSRPRRFMQLLGLLSLVHTLYVAVPGAKRTRLFLVIGDLAIQLSND